MIRFRCVWRGSLARLVLTLRFASQHCRLLFLTLCYNVHVDKYYIADTAMEPMFWVVDHFTRFFGPLFVFFVCVLTTSAVMIAYMIGIPYWWQRNAFVLCVLFVLGHWLLVNIIFHYYMAVCTSPGYLPEGILIPEAVSICKKCISPKPPRAHHCSICNRCILKMDHHCPWLNNCVGHYNHRYFFLFMVYMVSGVIFLVVFGFGMVSDHLWLPPKPTFRNSTILGVIMSVQKQESSSPSSNYMLWMKRQHWYHVCLMYLSCLCIGVLVTLGALVVWHARLISRGETSIEALINKCEATRLCKQGMKFENPYNLGFKRNWIIFLGLEEGRNWRHILFPSRHKPIGRGLQWPSRSITPHVQNF